MHVYSECLLDQSIHWSLRMNEFVSFGVCALLEAVLIVVWQQQEGGTCSISPSHGQSSPSLKELPSTVACMGWDMVSIWDDNTVIILLSHHPSWGGASQYRPGLLNQSVKSLPVSSWNAAASVDCPRADIWCQIESDTLENLFFSRYSLLWSFLYCTFVLSVQFIQY